MIPSTHLHIPIKHALFVALLAIALLPACSSCSKDTPTDTDAQEAQVEKPKEDVKTNKKSASKTKESPKETTKVSKNSAKKVSKSLSQTKTKPIKTKGVAPIAKTKSPPIKRTPGKKGLALSPKDGRSLRNTLTKNPKTTTQKTKDLTKSPEPNKELSKTLQAALKTKPNPSEKPTDSTNLTFSPDSVAPKSLDKLFTIKDIRKHTPYKSILRSTNLPGIPDDAYYTSLRLKPINPTQYGVGLQVWRITNAAQQRKRFNKFLRQYTDAKITKAFGDSAFHASFGDILYFVWLDSKTQTITTLSCDTAICSEPETLVKLARDFGTKLDQVF